MDNIGFLQGIHRTNTRYTIFGIIMHYCLTYQKEFSIRDKIQDLYLVSLKFPLYNVCNSGRETGIGRKVREKAKMNTELGV